MKIKVKNKSYDYVMAIPKPKHRKPNNQSVLLRGLVKALTFFDMKAIKLKVNKIGMERLQKKEPCLYLMNHSTFMDLKIAFNIIKGKFNIICTDDGFIGKNLLMRGLGCIPTKKFMTDTRLVKDMIYTTKKLKRSVLLYPECGYTFDGRSTILPDSLGKLCKLLNVPVVMITANGTFLRDPLYNGLQIRKTNINVEMKYLLSPEEIKEKSTDELKKIIDDCFKFDGFKYQQENNIKVTEKFRADHLNRILYKCPNCGEEHNMVGKGIHIKCEKCNKTYELTETGYIKALDGVTEYPHIPDWYDWERASVVEEIKNESYNITSDVDIYMQVDTKCFYYVGKGELTHNLEGFHLTGCDGKIDYKQGPKKYYSINADFYWYELGDMICIGDDNARYYCIPKNKKDIVAKMRIATEEMYKLNR